MNLTKSDKDLESHLYLNDGNETQKKLFHDLEAWKILKSLHGFKPTVVGTIPLGIDLPNSDVDILTKFNLPSHLVKICYAKFRNFENFHLEEKNLHGEPTILVKFKTKWFHYEIFGQKVEPTLQDGFIHMKVEERILNIAPRSFRDKILELKKAGMKTEPAFSKLLGLSGDPYKQILELAHATDTELKQLISNEKKEIWASSLA